MTTDQPDQPTTGSDAAITSMARLARLAETGALPADDIRTVLAFAKGREAAVVEAFELGYRIGHRDGT